MKGSTAVLLVAVSILLPACRGPINVASGVVPEQQVVSEDLSAGIKDGLATDKRDVLIIHSSGSPFGDRSTRPEKSGEGHWLCVPGFPRVCPFEDQAATALDLLHGVEDSE